MFLHTTPLIGCLEAHSLKCFSDLAKWMLKEVRQRETGGKAEGGGGIKEKWKQKLAGAGQAFLFCSRQAVLFIGGGGGRLLQTEQSKVERPPFSSVGLFPVGRLCAGWMAAFWGNPSSYWAESEGWAWLARRWDTATAQQYNVCHCFGLGGKERDREKVTEDGGGGSGSVWFGQEGEVFLWWERENQKEPEEVDWEKKKKKAGAGEEERWGERQVSFTVLHWCIDLCLFMILHYSQD